MTRLSTIDAHSGGALLRLVTSGFPPPAGRTMREKREWADENVDRLRRQLLFQPRGHADVVGAALTEPVTPGAHAGVLFMDSAGYSGLTSHGLIAVATIAIERGLVMPGGQNDTILFDTEAGTVRVRAQVAPDGRVERIAIQCVPSFVFAAGLAVTYRGRHIPADLAYGGAFCAIVDSEAAGVALNVSSLPEVRRAGIAIRDAIVSQHLVVHPVDEAVKGIQSVMFTSAAGGSASALRSVTIFADGQVDPSPSETGTAALTAVLSTMGLLGDGDELVHEGLSGVTLRARVTKHTAVAGYEAILPEVDGIAWIVSEQQLIADDRDSLAEGFRI